MSDEPTDPVDPVDPTADPVEPEPDKVPTLEELTAERDKWKNLSRQHESKAKANSDAARKLAALEEADKTEQQKTADRLAEAERQAKEAKDDAARLRVALDKKLDPALAARLVGATEEELAEDADRLLALMAPKKNSAIEGGADGGPRGPAKPGQLKRADLASMTPEQIVTAKAKGQLDDLMGVNT